MQKKNCDCGINFGKWTDETSIYMYNDSTQEILKKINLQGKKIVDLGGGNGIIKKFLPNAITIDSDATKNPDVVANILTYQPSEKFDAVILRYVLHYLSDYEILQLFENLKKWHKGHVLIQQFANEDLKAKYKNSINEKKFFRCEKQLLKLLPKNATIIYRKKYLVKKEFYKNRLQNNNGVEHEELMLGIYIKNL